MSSEQEYDDQVDDEQEQDDMDVEDNENAEENDNDEEQQNRKKRKMEFDADQSAAKRAKKKEQQEEKLKKKLMKPNAQLVAELLYHWENFRQKTVEKSKRNAIIDQVLVTCKGKIMDIIFKSDACRVIESILKLGLLKHRELVWAEVKDDVLMMSKNHYGHHVVLKLLKYGSKEMKMHVMKQFNGKLVKLCKHRDASEVLEYLFAEVADKNQKLSMLEEFWSPEFGIIKSKTPRKLEQILESEPERRPHIIKYLHETLLALLNRKDTAKAAAFTHSIVHEPILKYLELVNHKERSEMISHLAEHVVRFLHTKPGSLAGVLCVGYGSAKDRKVITRSFKGYVDRICREENGHVVLLKLLEATDDTVLTGKSIYAEMKKNLLDIANDKNGRLSLLLLLSPGNKRYFHPITLDHLKVFEVADATEPEKMVPTSKKDAEKRHSELMENIYDEIKEMCIHRAFSLITSVYGRDVLTEAIIHAEGDAKTEMVNAVLELCDYDAAAAAASKSSKYAANEKKKFHALDFLREEEPTKEDMLSHSLGHRTIRRLVDEVDGFADLLLAKIEPKLAHFAARPYSSWIVFDLARSEKHRNRVATALKNSVKELQADEGNKASQLLAKFVQNPKDASIFEKPSQDAPPTKQERPKAQATPKRETQTQDKVATPKQKTPQKSPSSDKKSSKK